MPSQIPATREERLNNPMGVERVAGVTWQGQSPYQPDERFVSFLGPGWGIRAGVRCLMTAIDKDGMNTIGKLVDHWAPPNENDTGAYIADICQRCSFPNADAPVTHDSITVKLIQGFIHHENGRCIYTEEEIRGAISMAKANP